MSNRRKLPNAPVSTRIRVTRLVEEESHRILFEGVRVADSLTVQFHVANPGAKQLAVALEGGKPVEVDFGGGE